MWNISKTFALALSGLLVFSTLAHPDGVYNPQAKSVGSFEGINNNAPAPGGGLMLDGITTGIKAAYSTRKLLTAYAGNAIQVQETTGNTTTNIGFVANVLDTATLSTFCSGKTCKVITWYDQSGGGFDQTQATIANAPIIFQSGAVNFINSTRPAVLFVQASTTLLTNATLAQNPVNTLFLNAVLAMSGGTTTYGIVGGSGAGNNFYWRVTTGTLLMEDLASVSASLGTANIAQNVTGSVLETQYNSSTGAGSFWVDGAAANTFTSAHTMAGGGAIQIGNDTPSAQAANGSIGEIVMYDLVGGIPSGSRTSIETNQKTYWGTP